MGLNDEILFWRKRKTMNEKEHFVLLGSAGTGAAYATAKALRKNFKANIISTDTNPSHLVTTNLLSDSFEQVAEAACDGFNDQIINIINKYQIDTFIPFVDVEVYKLAELYQSGKISNKISLQVKDSETAQICNDKYKTFKWLIANNLPTPETYLIEDFAQLRSGYILKPRWGFASTIQKITSPRNIIISDFNKVIMQEQCYLPEITIDVHYSKQFGFFRYVCRERIETKSGVCTKARLFQNQKLGDLASTLSEKLNLSSFCFQVMTKDNDYLITDINPRLGGGTAMSAAIGQDFFSAMFANLWGENPKKYFNVFSEEKYVTRQYCEFIS